MSFNSSIIFNKLYCHINKYTKYHNITIDKFPIRQLFLLSVGRVPARYVRQSQMCPQLDGPTKITKRRKMCPTELDMSDNNCNKKPDMSDRARYVRQK